MDDREAVEKLSYLLKRNMVEDHSQIEEFEEFLGVDSSQRSRDSLLGVCIHFTPKRAFSKYQGENQGGKEPYVIIKEFLVSEYGIREEKARELSRRLGHLWDQWFEERDVSNKKLMKKEILRKQNHRCKNCKVRLNDETNSKAYNEKDKFKPIHKFDKPQTKAELDHKRPVSNLGGNKMENLQILCRFCNCGKGTSTRVSITEQLENTSSTIEELKPSYRRKIFYSVTSNKQKCQNCGSSDTELSVDIDNNKGCYFISNLKVVCVDCKF